MAKSNNMTFLGMYNARWFGHRWGSAVWRHAFTGAGHKNLPWNFVEKHTTENDSSGVCTLS